MDWTSMKVGLKAIVATMAGLSTPGAVEWQDTAAASAYRAYPCITLSARSELGVGQDERRFTAPDADGNRVAHLVGVRQFVLVVKVESDNAESQDAKIYAGRIRAFLSSRSTLRALRAMNLGVGKVEATVDTEYKNNGRKLSACVTDIGINATEDIVDSSPRAGDYIASAHIVGDALTDAAGHDVPVDIDVTEPTP